MSAPNRYAVNPPPRGPGWFQRHGKEVLIGTAVVGGVAVVGTLAWVVVSSLLGGQQPPACTALQNQLYALQKEQLAIYQQAARQGGTFTDAQAVEAQSLAQQIANVVAAMSGTCIASPGETLERTIDQIIVFGLWGAAIVLGIVASAFAIRWFIKRWGGPKDGSEKPPASPDDVQVSPEFDDSTVGADLANGEVAGEFESGQITDAQAQTTASNLAVSDPAVGVADTIASFFRQVAAGASEAAAELLDALAALWDAIVSALEDAYLEIVLFLGI
jgi:hypothetical protein